MEKYKKIKMAALLVALEFPLILSHPAFAASGDVTKVEDFIRSIIKIVVGLAGLIATGFFVYGGIGYITSSGNPDRMASAKSTLIWAAVGLAIVIGAFVIANIVTDLATSAFGS